LSRSSNCSSRKESRRTVKSLIRRRKKQLFDDKKMKKKRKRKSKRQRRSLLPSLFNVDWIFGERKGKGKKKKKVDIISGKETMLKAKTLLKIPNKTVKSVPSEFFQLVTSSNLELSKFSGQQSLTKTTYIVVKNKQNKRKNRNYKRRNSLFNFVSSESWAGTLSDSAGSSCPAYLITPRHAVTSGGCALSTVTASLSVIFSVYRVTVTVL
jgi:hypothetical protein